MMSCEHRFYRLPELPGLEIRHGRGACIAYGVHAHDVYSVGLVLAGKTDYQCENRHYSVRRGDVMVLPPHTPHACNPEPGHWHYLMLYIAPEMWRQTVGAVAGTGAPWRSAALSRVLLALLGAARAADATGVAQAWAAAAHLLRQRVAAGPTQDALWRQRVAALPDSGRSPAEERQWRRVLAPSGMSPHRWRLNRRINRARQWLRQGVPLAEVAYRLGFADQAHFQRLFKHYTAVTPGQYRRNAA